MFSSGCIPFMIKDAPEHSSKGRSQDGRRCFRSVPCSWGVKSIVSRRTRGEYLTSLKLFVVTLLVGMCAIVPKEALAGTTQEPVVEALVQLPNEESDWKM